MLYSLLLQRAEPLPQLPEQTIWLSKYRRSSYIQNLLALFLTAAGSCLLVHCAVSTAKQPPQHFAISVRITSVLRKNFHVARRVFCDSFASPPPPAPGDCFRNNFMEKQCVFCEQQLSFLIHVCSRTAGLNSKVVTKLRR